MDTQEINLTVDHVGLTEPPKLIMIDYVLKLTELSILHYLLLIPPDVVDSYHVSQWDVTEDKSELLGPGSNHTELSLEEILEIKIPVIHIPWLNVTITLIQPNIQHVPPFHQLPQNVTKLVTETVLLIVQINTKLPHHMELDQSIKLKLI